VTSPPLLRLAVLGDSIGHGTGASRTEDTLASRLTGVLAAAGHPTEHRVLAVPGSRSEHLAEQVRRAVAWQPDVAVCVIGANDLTHVVDPVRAAAALRRAVRELRAAGAEVVVAPAPDLSVVPHVPRALRRAVQVGSGVLRAAQVRATLAEGGRVADVAGTTSGAFAADPALFSADRFHPSSAGYEVIARALAPVVLDAARRTAA
jgi:lysophospholipase L1-like esterase